MNYSYPKPAKIVIAHRGASGYLPEHSMAAKVMAYTMEADYIEQDVVMTKDNQLVVFHDPYLDNLTNAAEIFPNHKNKKTGQYEVIDFTLEEIKTLKITERFKKTGKKIKAQFPERFPLWKSTFQIHTLAEEIELIQGLNQVFGKNTGIFPEIKVPWFYHSKGKDIGLAILKLLKKYGYQNKSDPVFLQCLDPIENQRIYHELFPQLGIELKLIQLLAPKEAIEQWINAQPFYVPDKVERYFRSTALDDIAQYADAIGPHLNQIIDPKSTPNKPIISSMVKKAHRLGMAVYPYTLRMDKGWLPNYADNFEKLLCLFLFKANTDGIFTDFPDRARQFLNHHKLQ